MKILALDLGSTLGFATGINDKITSHDSKEFWLKQDKEHGNGRSFSNESFANFFNWVHGISRHVDIIVCEKPNVYGTGNFSSFHAMRVLFGMYGIVQAVAGGWHKSLIPVSATTIKKFWTEDGRADKKEMLVHAAKRGYSLKDHNECDAIAIYHYYWEVLRAKPLDDNEDSEG